MSERSAQQSGLTKEQILKVITEDYEGEKAIAKLNDFIKEHHVNSKDEKWLRDELAKEEKLRKIERRKIDRAREKAMDLSKDEEFVRCVRLLRTRWNIKPRLPDPVPRNERRDHLLPDFVLRIWAFDVTNPSVQQWHQLKNELRDELCEPFELDWLHDFGIIVGAVCFGLTHENIVENWDRIYFTLAKEVSPGVTIEIRTKTSPDRAYPAMVVLYLLQLLEKQGTFLQDLPPSIQEAIEYVQKLPGQPKQLLVDIGPTTLANDVKTTWPQVEEYQRALWGSLKPRERVKRVYERDTAIWLMVHQDKWTLEEAFNQWLKDNPVDDPPNTSTIRKFHDEIHYVWTEDQEF